MNKCPQTVDLKEDAEPQSSEKRECVQKKCRCGRSKPKMMLQNQKCKSRCPCHKNKLACTIDCDCVNCDNPHGSTRGNIFQPHRTFLSGKTERENFPRKMVKRGNISFTENRHDINKKE